MRALTLIRPWCWAILHAGKDVENRVWAPSPKQLVPGEWFAIHSGAKWDDAAVRSIDQARIFDPAFMLGLPAPDRWPGRRIVGLARFGGTTTEANSRWANRGSIHWLIDEVRVLQEPLACLGALGLWALPVDVEERVRAQETP